jgi:hypothetical protein
MVEKPMVGSHFDMSNNASGRQLMRVVQEIRLRPIAVNVSLASSIYGH